MLCFYITEWKSHAIALTEKAVASGATEIIAVGGDGTLNEVINGVMLAKSALDARGEPVSVSVFPKGTANDFARTVNMRPDLTELKKSINEDLHQQIDLGLATYTDTTQKNVSRYFINITDVGMGGIIAKKVALSSKWMGTSLTFQWAIISTLLNYKKQRISVTTEDEQYSGEMINVVIANGKYFGSGLGIAPAAIVTDKKFSIVNIGNISIPVYLKFLGDLKKCRIIHHPEVNYVQASSVTLSSVEKLPIDMDGEFVGYSPLEISIVPSVLKFRVPCDTGQ